MHKADFMSLLLDMVIDRVSSKEGSSKKYINSFLGKLSVEKIK